MIFGLHLFTSALAALRVGGQFPDDTQMNPFAGQPDDGKWSTLNAEAFGRPSKPAPWDDSIWGSFGRRRMFPNGMPEGMPPNGMPQRPPMNGMPQRPPMNGMPQGPPMNGMPQGPPMNGMPQPQPKPENPTDNYWDNFWDTMTDVRNVWEGAVDLWEAFFGERRLEADSETAVDALTLDEPKVEVSSLESRLQTAGLSGDDQRRRITPMRPPGVGPPIKPIVKCKTNRGCGWGQECSRSGGFCVEKGGGFYGARCTHKDHCYHVGYYCTGYSAPPGARPKIGHCEHKKHNNEQCDWDDECHSGFCWFDHNGQGKCEPDEATGTF